MDAIRQDCWTAAVSEASATSIKKLGKLIDLSDPPDFFEFTCRHWDLRDEPGPWAWDILMEGQFIIRAVGHPVALTLNQALTLTRFAMQLDPLFDTKLLRRLFVHRVFPEEAPSAEVMRTLAILETLDDDPHRLSMTLYKFSKFPDKRVQSKVAKILGRCVESIEIMRELFQNPDARVRANLLEGLSHKSSLRAFQPIIELGVCDQNARVSSFALAIRARDGNAGAAALIKMRLKSKMDDVRKPAEYAQLMAAGGSSGRDVNGVEINGAERGSLAEVDTVGVINPELATAASVEEVDSKA